MGEKEKDILLSQETSYGEKENQEAVFDLAYSNMIGEILNTEACPNCGMQLTHGKCEDAEYCGYGHGDAYYNTKQDFKKNKDIEKCLKARDLSTKNKGSGEKIKVFTNKFSKDLFYYNYHGRIKDKTAELELEYNGERLKFNVSYETMLIAKNNGTDEYKIIKNVEILGSDTKKVQIKKGKRRVKTFFNFVLARDIAREILKDYTINKYL